MRDILQQVLPWFDRGERFAVATVVRTWDSAPRPPGAAMAVSAAGEAVGSVSGGCVEGAVYDVAQRVLETGVSELVTYGVSDDDAFSVGLTCGGTIQLQVDAVDSASFPGLRAVADAVAADEPIAVATVLGSGTRVVVSGSASVGSLGSDRLDSAVVDDARGMLDQGRTGLLHTGADGERRHDELEIFVESYAPAPRMIVFGAIDFAAAVARAGTFVGYRVTVCDARPVFATRARFPDVDELVVQWPHDYLASIDIDERTVLCVLTHDPKFDIPLLTLALRTRAAYVGAMGSRATHDERVALLREAGVTDTELARLHSPIGLDLGARTPEETAISIVGEIIANRWGATGAPLRTLADPIHRPVAEL